MALLSYQIAGLVIKVGIFFEDIWDLGLSWSACCYGLLIWLKALDGWPIINLTVELLPWVISLAMFLFTYSWLDGQQKIVSKKGRPDHD